jgi:hypothetical protein
MSEASQWPVESDDEGLVTTECPVDGSLVIVVSARAKPLAKARTEADNASVFNITDLPCCCDTTKGSARKRGGQTLVPIGDAKPDKRITAIPAHARVGQHLAGHGRQSDLRRGEQTAIDPRN